MFFQRISHVVDPYRVFLEDLPLWVENHGLLSFALGYLVNTLLSVIDFVILLIRFLSPY